MDKVKNPSFLARKLGCDTIDLRAIMQIFLPLLVDQFIVAFLTIVNSSMVSSYGQSSVAAVNMVDPVNNFLLQISTAIATGGAVVVAQYIGRKEPKNAGFAGAQAIFSSTGVALIFTLMIVFFSRPILNVLFGSVEKEIMDNGLVYFVGYGISFPSFAAWQAGLGIMRGTGNGRASMISSIIVNIIYVGLDLLLINVFQLGLLGLVISINIARFIGAVSSIVFLLKRSPELEIRFKHFLRWDGKIQKSIMLIGLPTAAEQLFFNGGRILTQTYIVTLGTAALTINAITNSLAYIYTIVGNVVALTVTTVVAQCIGAGRKDEGKRMLISWLWVSMILSVFACIGLRLVAPAMLGLYHPNADYVSEILYILTLEMIFVPTIWSFGFVFPAGMRAAGDAKFTSVVALVTMWVIRVALGYVLAVPMKMGIRGVWYSMYVEWAIRGVVFGIRFLGKRWMEHKII